MIAKAQDLKYLFWLFLLGAGLVGLLVYIGNSNSSSDQGPSSAKSPKEQLAGFKITEGLKIELVAAEPMVQDPVVISFDEDGRLWVVEMRGFMPNIDGEGEQEPVGRISVLEDTNGDGKMDKSTIYLEGLIMPRALAVIKGGALVVENMALWHTQDHDGDLIADQKTLIDPDYAGNNLPEHSGNGLWRGLDNWYYNAKSSFRYKYIDGQWKREDTESRGQWGISHDDYGRLVYNYNWSQLHADLVPPNYFSRNTNHKTTTGVDHGLTVDRRIYPIRPNPAINRGYIPGILDEEGRLMEFTSACAPHYYRGSALPDEFFGNVFVCEPSGNLIKRNVVKNEGIYMTAEDPNPGKEFLASTDERFRPVNLASGPDGALYVADMYRGLVQHGAYLSPYLREKTLERNLELPINRGRIWRIVPEDWEPSSPEKLSEQGTEALVQLLSHPNGWYRDMAQRLLVEKNDPASKGFLENASQKWSNPIGVIHALWTLEGLNMLDPVFLFSVLTKENSQIRANALRLLEPFARKDENIQKELGSFLLEEWKNPPQDLALQLALSAEVLATEVGHAILVRIAENFVAEPVIRDAIISSLEAQEFNFLNKLASSATWKIKSSENEVFLEMLSTAILKNGKAGELKGLLTMVDVDKHNFGWREKALLAGITHHANQVITPVRLPSPPKIVKEKPLNIDPGSLEALTLVFDWPGLDRTEWATTKQHQLTEDEQKQFALGRQYYLSSCSGCHGNNGEGANRLGPPLARSEWVTGSEKQLSLIILHGMVGPVKVNGIVYDQPEILPVMPAQSSLDDNTIAAIMTYVRNEWGNNAGAVNRRTVGSNRNTLQGRVYPWKAEELKQYH